MDFRDGRHRQRRGGGAATTAEDRRLMATLHRNEERRHQRDNLHRANRRQEPAPAPEPAAAPAAAGPAQPGESRKDQLRRWLAERDQKQKLEKARRAREPAPFRPAGAVHHKVALYKHMSAAARRAAETEPAKPTVAAGRQATQPAATSRTAAHGRPAAPTRAAPQPVATGRRVTRSMARPTAAAAAVSRPSPARGRAAATRGARPKAAPPRRETPASRVAAAAAMASVAPLAAATRRGTRAAPVQSAEARSASRPRGAAQSAEARSASRPRGAAQPAEACSASRSRGAAQPAEACSASRSRGRAAAQPEPAAVEPIAESVMETETAEESETEAAGPVVEQRTDQPAPEAAATGAAAEEEPQQEAEKAASAVKPSQEPSHVSFAPEQHQFQAPEGVTSHVVFRTPTRTVRPSFRKTPRHLPPTPAAADSGSEAVAVGTPASCIASAIEEFRHLVGSPWITLTRGSSSKKKRREEKERQQRLADSINMDVSTDMSADEAAAAAASGADSGADAPSTAESDAAPGSKLSPQQQQSEPTTELEPAVHPEPEPAQQLASTKQPEMKPEPAGQIKSEPAPTPAVAATAAGEECGAGPELSIAYFRRMVSSETERLSSLAVRWEAVMAAGGLPAEPLGEVHSVTGQARLLVRERFMQFEGLVDSAEFLRGPRPTTLTDLQGFWEMIYFQVEDVDRKFASLDQLKAAGWRSTAAPAPAAPAARARKPPAPAARRPAVKKAGPSAALRAAMLAARKKMQAETPAGSSPEPAAAPAPAPAPAATQTPCRATSVTSDGTPAPAAAAADPERRFTGGFFSVATPPVPASPANTQEGVAARHQRAELRRSLLLSGARPRRTSDLSPLVRVSMSAKLAQQTPSRLAASLQMQKPSTPASTSPAETEKPAPLSRASRRRSALTELSSNTPAAGRSVRRSRRQPSLLGEPAALASPLPAPLAGDLISFDSPAPAAGRRKSRRLTSTAAGEPAAPC